jgi:hypothetical protein
MRPSTRKDTSDPTLPVREEVFRLNLGYLLAVRELLALGAETQAEIVFGLKEPLAAWLRSASAEAIATLAASPTLIYEPRLAAPALERILSACEGAATRRWLARVHLALASAETNPEPAG